MTREEKITTLNSNLPQFTGTGHWYKHSLNPRVTYTDGVKYLAEVAGAYWLIDEIALNNKFKRKLQAEEFQVWTLNVKDDSASLVCDDGNGNVVFRKKIDFTDFPLDKIELYFENDVICLPSER